MGLGYGRECGCGLQEGAQGKGLECRKGAGCRGDTEQGGWVQEGAHGRGLGFRRGLKAWGWGAECRRGLGCGLWPGATYLEWLRCGSSAQRGSSRLPACPGPAPLPEAASMSGSGSWGWGGAGDSAMRRPHLWV